MGALAIQRELIDLARKYGGPHGLGANHHSDRCGKAGDDPGEPLDLQPWDGGKPVDLEQWTQFHECVKKLPREERQLTHYLWYQGLSLHEAAQLLGLSNENVKTLWRSAKGLLQKCCKEMPPL